MSNLESTASTLRQNLNNMRNSYISLLETAKQEEAAAREVLKSSEAQTDRSENQVYTDARDAQARANANIAQYSKKLMVYDSYATDYVPKGYIRIGTTVKLKLNKPPAKWPYKDSTAGEVIMMLVPESLGNARMHYLDATSLVGSAILNHKAGDTVRVQTISGTQQYKIEEIY